MLFAPSNLRLSRKGSAVLFAAGVGMVLVGITLMKDKYLKSVKSEVEKAVKKETPVDDISDSVVEDADVATKADDAIDNALNEAKTNVDKSQSNKLIGFGLSAMCLAYASQTKRVNDTFITARRWKREFENAVKRGKRIKMEHDSLRNLIVDIAAKGGGVV